MCFEGIQAAGCDRVSEPLVRAPDFHQSEQRHLLCWRFEDKTTVFQLPQGKTQKCCGEREVLKSVELDGAGATLQVEQQSCGNITAPQRHGLSKRNVQRPHFLSMEAHHQPKSN